MNKLNKIIDLLIGFFIACAVSFPPVFFALFLKTNNVFELNKIILFKILVILQLALTVIKAVLNYEYFGRFLRKLWRENKFVIAACLLLLCSFVLSSLFSSDPTTSLFGSYELQQGALTLFYFILFFVLIIINVKSAERIRRLIWFMVLASILVSVYAIIQISGYDPLSWFESTQKRACSTFGQPNNLALYLLFAIPLSVYLFLTSKKALIKIFLAAVFILQSLAFFYTYSLGCWLGLFGAIFILAVSAFFFKPDFPQNLKNVSYKFKILKFNLLLPCLIILIIGLLAVFGLTNFQLLKSRVNNLTNLRSGSTAARIDFWGASLKAIKEELLLGYGPEMQSDALFPYYRPDWAEHSAVNVNPNRSHNFFLDVLLSQGLIGLTAWLCLFFLYYFYIIKNIKQNKEVFFNCIVFFILTSYLIAMQFHYSNIAVDIYFWTLLAFILIINRLSELLNDQEELKESNSSLLKNKISSVLKLSLVILVGVFAVLGIKHQIQLLIADHYFFEFRQSKVHNQYFAALTMYDYIKEICVDYGYYDRQFTNIMADWLEDLHDVKFKKFGEDKLKQIQNKIPNESYANIFVRARINSILANKENMDYFDKAESDYSRLITISPDFPKTYYEAARLYFQAEKFKEAIYYHALAIKKFPSLNNPYINKQHEVIIRQEMAKNLSGLGDAHSLLGDKKSAIDYYTRSLDNYQGNALIYIKIARIYKELHDDKNAFKYAQTALDLSSNDNYIKALAADVVQGLGVNLGINSEEVKN